MLQGCTHVLQLFRHGAQPNSISRGRAVAPPSVLDYADFPDKTLLSTEYPLLGLAGLWVLLALGWEGRDVMT